jgi:diguanylate cyclase (GGDEF)-like protein
LRAVQLTNLFRSATVRVVSLSLFLVGAGTIMAIVATSLSGQVRPPFVIPWWAFAPAIMAAEGLMFHIERKTETHSFNLSEIPLVVGFFFASPWAVIAGRLAGQLAYRLIVRRQAPIKIMFNLSSFWAETAVAMCLFRTVAAHTSPLSPAAWFGILVAVLTADLVSMVAVTWVIRWTGGESHLRSVLVTGLLTAGINTGLSILAAIILWASPWAFLLLCLVIVSFTVLYGRYLALNQRYSGLQMLYGFTQMVGASLKAEAVTEEVLAEARKLLRSGRAEIVLLDEQSGGCAYRLVSQDGEGSAQGEALEIPALQEEPVWNDVIARQTPALIPRGTRNPSHLSFLTRVGAADCMIAPLVSEEKIVGSIMVADRQSNLTSFDGGDLKLFATLANHASVAFENGRLVERLRKEAEERRHEALHDSLTGLPNRTLFVERIAALGENASEREAAVMLMDLDRFKEVNDTLGHHNGDLLLQEVAARLVDILRSCDTVARLGGDEFAILLPGAGSAEQVMTSAARIVDALEHPFQLEGLRVDIGASIGVASYPEHGEDAATLLKRADVAMYQAKSGDRHIVLYTPESDHNTPERLTLAADLRHALTDDQIEIYYQPKARLSDGSVVGVEALLRWDHPTRGRIGPAEFVPVAEQSGLITPLTMRILRASLTHVKEWSRAGYDLHVSVNLALRSLLDTDMPSQVEALLLEIGVPSDRLTLEITESSVMADPPRTIAVLERLAALGVRLSVDDFGTGYSSLSYLRRLPVNEVKIDQSFVLRMASEPTDAAVVRSIIELSHNLGLSTVAEGVEDAASWEMLREMGCDEVQGYHLSRPMHSSSFGRWLSNFQRPLPRPSPSLPVDEVARSVLVVDDDWLMRDLVSNLLDDAGLYEVHEASDGWEAIAQARLHQPDVIILDLAMPRMSGLDALPSIRAVAPKSRVVVLTSTDDRRMAAKAVEQGATAFLDKALGLELIPQQVALALAS